MGGYSSKHEDTQEQQAVTPPPTEMSVCTPKELGEKLFQMKDDTSKQHLVDQILDWEGPSKEHLKKSFKEAGGNEEEYEALSKAHEDRKKAKAEETAAAQKEKKDTGKSETAQTNPPSNGFIF